ncbi:MAG: cupin domain-containing protein [Lysobacterales bacterium]|nr:MAG: cupin domain-containing protein [Xanthomonadales bacterium]
MKQPIEQLPIRLEAGGVCIQAQDWGDLNVARIRFPKGADATPLLEGLPQNLCQCPHWGTVLRGSIHVRYADGREEVVRAGEVYYWPAGHTVWVDEDYEAVEFSPAGPMGDVIDHLDAKLST